MVKKYDVVKSNELVRNTKSSFSVQQQKMILYVVSKIKPNDKKLNYKFTVKDFCEVLGIDSESGGNYKIIKNSLLEIRNGGFWLRTEKGVTATAFFHGVTITDGSGTVDIEIHERLYPFLVDLKTHYTQYQLENALRLNSKYSVELYEYFKSYEHAHKTSEITLKVTVENLKEKLNVTKLSTYDRFVDFRRMLLDKAIKEINRETDITVTYKTKRTGRPITHLIFKVTSKTGDEYFDIPYVSETLDHHNPNQLTMEELLKRGHETEKE